MKKKPVSIAVVAEKAGVSSMTVSRVIRGESAVKEETRSRVIAAMRVLDYVPSAAAQSLRSRDHFRSAGTPIRTVFGCRSSQEACDVVRDLWKDDVSFDGMFTNDDLAVGALAAFRELGVSVPGEVKIVGFDDIQYASFTTPTLTSIRIDKFLLGSEAVQTLVSMNRAPERLVEMKKVIRPTLIKRQSTSDETILPPRFTADLKLPGHT